MERIFVALFCVFNFGLFTSQPAMAAEWTFLVYLDADNNLEHAGIDDFLEMSSVGSDANINIVVQFDRIPGYSNSFGNWTDCQRFLVTNGMTPEVINAVSDWGDGNGGREVNMADPETLVDFVLWAMTHYPANRYAVVLWNHGGGWRDALEVKRPILKAVCWDDTSGMDEAMEMKEVKQAFKDIGWVDLIGFDACLMGMVEVAYEIRNFAEIMVSSEETEPGDGWPYNTLLSDLVVSPTMGSADLGATIVNRYGEANGIWSATTQSCIDLRGIDDLAGAVTGFGLSMDSKRLEIAAARAGSQEYHYPENIDLSYFAELVYSGSSDSNVQSMAAGVMAAVDSAVISEFHGNLLPNSHGLTIYFPKTIADFDSDYNSSTIDFPADTEWDEFLQWYYGAGGSGIILLTPADSAVLSSSEPPTFSWEAGPGYRYKMEFSPIPVFFEGSPKLPVPPGPIFTPVGDTTTGDLPVQMWINAWNIIKRIEQINGIVYWRVIGRDVPPSPLDISEVRSFSID